MLRRTASVLLCLALGAGWGAGLGPAGSPPAYADDASAAGLPSVFPVPRAMQARGADAQLGASVALVTEKDTDAPALRVVRRALQDAGVKRIDEVHDLAGVPADEAAVRLDGAGDDPATEQALGSLGAHGAAGLPAEGYVLAAGRADGRSLVVLDGHDARGTYYAAQTLRQLIEHHGEQSDVPGVEVRDWPSYPLRGVIEGFYGTPWSHAARLSQLDFYGAHKMNTYVYSPKDDAYLRDRWRDPYPADQLAQLKELADRAAANHVDFTYALSPGLSVCYSSADDEKALVAKFQSLWDVGVRSFAVPLDDISYTKWNCAADEAKFGTGGGAAGAAQAYLLNQVQKDFIATHSGAARLQMVPTEYYNTTSSPYKDAVKSKLDPAVVVEWTGVGVVPAAITKEQAAAAKSVFGHDILVWDNYPVNDYVTDRLLLGPYVGRDAGMTGSLYGITANPMIQPEASKISLFNVADFTWNDAAYDPQRSWQASLDELAGGDTQARAALRAFADLEHSSVLDKTQAPELARRIADFRDAWESADPRAAEQFDGYLRVIEDIPSVLTHRMGDPAFVDDARPWMDSAGAWGGAARAALRVLVDQRQGDGAAAVADRHRAEALMAKARSYQYEGLRGTVNVTVGDGVIDRFVKDVLAADDRWLGVTGHRPSAVTSMRAYQANAPDRMIDGDDSTYFWSDAAPSPGDYVGVDLGSVQPVSAVSVAMAKSTSPEDYIHKGVLEYSADGSSWTAAGTYEDTKTVKATFPAGAEARYVRLRATDGQQYWVVVREFTVERPPAQDVKAEGAPAPASGSSFAAAVDADLGTAYTAAAAPHDGDALLVTLPKARPLDAVEIVGKGAGTVQVRSEGSWRTLGSLSDGYTQLSAKSTRADAIRLLWAAGSPAPEVSEVVPWYADAPAADLTASLSPEDLSVGQTGKVTAGLTATRAETVRGTLTAEPPQGLTVRPATQPVTLERGDKRSLVFEVHADAAGTYKVPVTFRPAAGDPVTTVLTVRVHP